MTAAGGARDFLAEGEAPTYFDDKGNSLRLIRTRTERDNYDVRSNELGLAEQCPAVDTSATGCTMFTLSKDERYVDVVITDQTGRPVGAFIKQDYDDDPNWDGAWISVCEETAEPVRVLPGARIQITIDADGCQGRSSPTLGTIVARVYRAA